MIVGNMKPLEEIVDSLSGFRKVLILGCGSCVTVCLSGGDREARQLALELSRSSAFAGSPPVFAVDTIIRQCERDLVSAYQTLPSGTEAILSLACGCGVQTLGDVFEPLPVIPALNTTFYGASTKPACGRRSARGAETACCPSPAASVPWPAVPRACSTGRAAAPKTGAARSMPMFPAPGP